MTAAVAILAALVVGLAVVLFVVRPASRGELGRHAPRYVARHRHPSAGRARRRDAPDRGRVSWPSDAPTNPEE